ncbi:FtsX-like permease family protein [Microbacterium sp. P02]|uniref:FtsX-like permease family protein n=1 Tax=Microbacterium sp. P02 TaxID=3366260 RepID=UPI00366AA422
MSSGVLTSVRPRRRGAASALALTRLFLRPGVTRKGTVLLPVVAFAAVTALVLIVVGGAQTFWRTTDDLAGLYQLLAVVALALLLVPLVTVGGAAARLSARRRDDRLATLRLLGASSTTVRSIAVLEATTLAGSGSLAGTVVFLATSPLVGLIRFRGAALTAGGVLLPVWAIVVVCAGIVLLAAVSAIASLRRVVVSPLGVRTRDAAPHVAAIRAVIAVVAIGLGYAVMSLLGAATSMIALVVVLGAVCAGILGALSVIGPWLVRVLARLEVRRARTPERLLAARAMLESPYAIWRQVAPLAMASFVAVFAGVGAALMDVAAGGASSADAALVTDIRTGLAITVIGTFVMVACATAIGQATGILDRTELYRGLSLLGVPSRTMDAARRRETMLPVRVAVVGSAVAAAVVLLPLTGIALIVSPVSIVVIVATIGIGVLIVWAALAATRPLLRAVATGPA